MTPTLTQALAWAADGAAHLRGMMTRMGDDAFAKPSSLPDWTRAHVLTHVARNADAMVNLVTWARTGVPTPAYPSRDERDADIETGAGRTPAEIRADLIASSNRLAAAVREMPEQAWSARIADTRGRRMIASVSSSRSIGRDARSAARFPTAAAGAQRRVADLDRGGGGPRIGPRRIGPRKIRPRRIEQGAIGGPRDRRRARRLAARPVEGP